MSKELNTIKDDLPTILKKMEGIVPTYLDMEQFGKNVLARGIMIADNIMETNDDDNTKLRAINTIISINKHITERIDAENNLDEDLEDDLDEINS